MAGSWRGAACRGVVKLGQEESGRLHCSKKGSLRVRGTREAKALFK